MRGAALGLAADDFLGIAQGQAVRGVQGQVDGHPWAALAQRLGQISGQGAVEPPLGFGAVGQGGPRGQPRGLVGRGNAEAFASIGFEDIWSGRPDDDPGAMRLRFLGITESGESRPRGKARPREPTSASPSEANRAVSNHVEIGWCPAAVE
jgi:hypothetical protein